jgi:ribonucleoside-diphosphate reductase beta chain
MPLDFESQPLREMRKGRALQWDPHAIDLKQDKTDWLKLTVPEQGVLLSQVLGFFHGERAVAHDLAPLQQALRRERGRMHEEMYLTQQMYEESTHLEFFQRWLFEVLPGRIGETVPRPPGQQTPIVNEHMPRLLTALLTDSSPRAQMRATVVYHQIVEGVLAEVGYQAFYDCLDPRGIFPGLRTGLRNIQKDESRHIAFGTYLARRLIRDHPDLRDAFIEDMEQFRQPCMDASAALYGQYDEPFPFGLDPEKTVAFSVTLFRRRLDSVLSATLVEA